MPCKSLFLLEGIYSVPQERCFLLNKTGRIKQEHFYVQITPRKFYFSMKYSSKLMYLPYTKGQHSTGQIPQWRQLRKLYIDFFGLICFILSLVPQTDHIRWGGSSLLTVLDTCFGGKAPKCRTLTSMGSQSLPTAAWHTSSVRLGC